MNIYRELWYCESLFNISTWQSLTKWGKEIQKVKETRWLLLSLYRDTSLFHWRGSIILSIYHDIYRDHDIYHDTSLFHWCGSIILIPTCFTLSAKWQIASVSCCFFPLAASARALLSYHHLSSSAGQRQLQRGWMEWTTELSARMKVCLCIYARVCVRVALFQRSYCPCGHL